MPIKKQSASVFTALPNGNGVLLNLETLLYFSLNRTGVALWQEIDNEETAELEQLVRFTCARFDVDQTCARKEIAGFVEQLARLGLLQVT